MRPSRRTARLPMLLLLACPLLPLAACEEAPPTSFAPLRYDYLSVLRLNVASISTVDNGVPGSVPGDISANAPTPPDQALLRMAADRLMPAGSTGSAVFTIDRASILHLPGGSLEGEMDVHLDIVSANGQRTGYAEAHVRRDFSAGSGDSDGNGNADSPAHLYDLTKQMMKDMNIELEFQVRHHLADWLVDTAGAGPGAIQQQSLGMPGATPEPAPYGAPVMPSAPVPAGPVPAAPAPGAAVPGAALPTAAVPASAAPAVAAPPMTAPAAAPARAPAPRPRPAPPVSAGPDAIFPTGMPGGAAAAAPSTPPAPHVLSPQPGYLTLPPGTTGQPSQPGGGY